MFPVDFWLQFYTKVLIYEPVFIIIILIKLFSTHLSFEAGYLSPMVSIYYLSIDFVINLLPDEPVPKVKIYSLSIPEQKTMEEYVSEALQQGYIRPYMSPAASSFYFFFVAKNDVGLRPCIDYRSLNKITVSTDIPFLSSHPLWSSYVEPRS